MYTVYVDNDIIYSPLLVNNGYIIFSGTANLKLNEPGTFEFVIPKSNPFYDRIIPRKSLIRLYDRNELIFKGVSSEYNNDFNNMKSVFCKGALSFLEDSICRPFEHRGTITQYLEARIKAHNEQVDSFKQFKIGLVTVTDSNNYLYRYKETYENTMTVLTEQLLNSYGGYFRVRDENGVNVLDYLADFPDTTIQSIEFGRNLLDFVSTSTTDDLFTAMIPLGADIEKDGDESEENEGYQVTPKVDITSVNGGKDYIIDQAAANIYGTIWRYQEYSDINVPANLLKKAKEDLAANVDINMTLEIPAFDLSLINANLDRIGVGKYTRIISRPHGFDKVLLCNEVEINLDDPENNKYIFGAVLRTSTDYLANANKNTVTIRQAAETANKANETAITASFNVQQAAETAQKATETAQQAAEDVEKIKGGIITKNDIYPVGSIHVSAIDTDPAVYYGGAWERLGQATIIKNDNPDVTEFINCYMYKRLS